ncbi:hypothetical protein QOZ80_6AG0510840 [Eleusine coracana subsp. coracana]|nr:hypothetical protein QOZ80_6AG0510840 [Eleusine coracana subsp. coracana]
MDESSSGEGAWPPVMLPVQGLVSGHVAADDVPARFVARAHDDAPATVAASVPVIDLGRLCRQDIAGADEEAAKLRLALESWGLFLVANHGIEASLMDDVMDASREFFGQPPEVKQKHTNLVDGKDFQLEGYGNDRVRSEDQVLDWCDRLYLKVEPEDDRNLALWPTHPGRFRDVLHKFAEECTSVRDRLLPEMAKALGLDDDYFSNQFGDKADTYARFSYYPPCPRPDLVFGLKPHSDGTFISILMVDNNVGGLQVLREGVWYDVPTRPHTLLINLGDQMEIMSNGIFKSPVHRVVTNAEKERLSVALFFSVDPEKHMEPAPQLVDEKQPALYRKVKTKDYIAGLFQYFSQGRRVIDTVKI